MINPNNESSNCIPKRLIHIWGGPSKMSSLAEASIKAVRLLNPGFQTMFLDDDLMSDLVNQDFPEYASVLENFPFAIQRYDFVRYLAVYKYGGFYSDVDVFFVRRFDDLLHQSCVFPFERLTWSEYLRAEYGLHWELGNYAFGASPGHPFLRSIIENCVRAQREPAWLDRLLRRFPAVLREELRVIYTTGPGLVSRTLCEYESFDRPVAVLMPEEPLSKERGWNQVGRYGAHIGGGTWRARHNWLRTRILNHRARRNERDAVSQAIKLGPQLFRNASCSWTQASHLVD